MSTTITIISFTIATSNSVSLCKKSLADIAKSKSPSGGYGGEVEDILSQSSQMKEIR
jgi:hypothetical protein